MKNLKNILILILALTSVFVSCRQKSVKEQSNASKADSASVFILKRETLKKKVSFPAELYAFQKASIIAKVSGYVEKMNVFIGDVVKKGQILCTLYSPETIEHYELAKSVLRSAKEKYSYSKDRYKKVYNASLAKGTVSELELKEIQTNMLSDSAIVAEKEAGLKAHKQILDYLTIRSPFNGVVTERNVDIGTLVDKHVLLDVEQNDTIRVRLPIPEELSSLKADSGQCYLTFDAYPEEKFIAHLHGVAGALQHVNRTEQWEFFYTNKDYKLKPGMLAIATVNFSRPKPTFIVPASALVTNLEKRFVVRLKNGIAEWVEVQRGIALENEVEIFGPLSEGDTILIRGTDEIKPGAKIIAKLESVKKSK